MSIRPIDLQLGLQRTTDSSRLRAVENATQEANNQGFATQLSKEVDVEISTVYEAKKDEKANLENNKNGDGKQERRDKQKKPLVGETKPKDKSHIPAVYTDGGSLIDINV